MNVPVKAVFPKMRYVSNAIQCLITIIVSKVNSEQMVFAIIFSVYIHKYIQT